MPGESGPLRPGSSFAGCTIERLIARGGLGALYAATEVTTGELRAIKIVAPAPGAAPGELAEAARRFQLEAQAMGRLQHPDIVRVYRAGQENGLAYLVMELLAGCDLARYTQPARLLPEAVALRVVCRVAGALAHAHARGVVHRDLKPENVMVDWASDRVTLTDFGLARTEDAERTRTGLVLGSPAYMAPELLAGQSPDARSDLYALGVMLYQLLTGELPFRATGLGDLLRQVAGTPAPDVRSLRPDLPASLADGLACLLAKAPADRPPSAQAVHESLAVWQAGCARVAAAAPDGAKSQP